MFYFLASKFITGSDSLRSIFIIGSICYIILHAYLFGNNASDSTQKFRHYLYYLFMIDAALTGSYIWLFGGDYRGIENEDEDDSNQSGSQLPQLPEHIREKLQLDQNGQNEQNGQSNIEEIHRKLLELRARQELKLKQDQVQGEPKNQSNNYDNSGTKDLINNLASSSNESPFAKKDINQSKGPQQKSQKIMLPNDNGDEDEEDEINNEENNRSYESQISNVSIPLYGSDNDLRDTDIPLYR